MADPLSPTWPRYGCKFCDRSYISHALLNRHHDLYLHEYVKAYALKGVKTYRISSHPLAVIRTIRSRSGRNPGKNHQESRKITWDDITFSAYDSKLDLATKLYTQRDVEAFESRALVSSGQWITNLGYLHAPLKHGNNQIATEDKEFTEDEQDESVADDEIRLDPAGAADNYPKNLGIVSRRLFSHVGVNKQIADGGGSHKVSAKDKVTINYVSNDHYNLATPSKTVPELMIPDRRKLKTNQVALFNDTASGIQDNESDWDIDSPVGHRHRKGKQKEKPKRGRIIPKWIPSPDPEPTRKQKEDQRATYAEASAAVVKGRRVSGTAKNQDAKARNEKPIVISPDRSDMGADTENDEGMDASDADILDPIPRQVEPRSTGHIAPSPTAAGPSKRSRPESVATEILKHDPVASSVQRHLARIAAPYATPRTHVARYFTPGNEIPVVLWLNVLLDANQPMLAVAVRDGCSLAMAIQQVRDQLRRRGVGEGWPELLGLEGVQNPGCVFTSAIWAAIMEEGGSMEVGLVWDL